MLRPTTATGRPETFTRDDAATPAEHASIPVTASEQAVNRPHVQQARLVPVVV